MKSEIIYCNLNLNFNTSYLNQTLFTIFKTLYLLILQITWLLSVHVKLKFFSECLPTCWCFFKACSNLFWSLEYTLQIALECSFGNPNWCSSVSKMWLGVSYLAACRRCWIKFEDKMFFNSYVCIHTLYIRRTFFCLLPNFKVFGRSWKICLVKYID